MAGYNALFRSPNSLAQDTWALTPQGEQLYQQQAAPRGTADYDMRGAWAQMGGGELPAQGVHFPDTWKRESHPTFSTGSRYSTPEHPGGSWAQLPGGAWAFVPSETNMQNMGSKGLTDYWDRVEPNNLLLLPQPTQPK